MNNGIPEKHTQFWQGISVEHLHTIFDSMTANPSKVLEKIHEPLFSNPNEQRVFNYLGQYIGEMKLDETKRFLRFVTGSSVLTDTDICVHFNALSGAARRPGAHTCTNTLVLPYTYVTFLEFVEEFSTLLSNEHCWEMHAV